MADREIPEERLPTEPKEHRWWHPLWPLCLLAIHTFIGIPLFLLILTPAVALNFLVRWLESIGVDLVIVLLAQLVEYTLILADVVLFIWFVYRTTCEIIRTIRTL